MSARRKTTVAVIFGGRSVEHDVSVVTGNQIIRAFDPETVDVVPVYISRDGRWFTGEPLLELKNYQDEIVSFKGVSGVVLSPSVQHHGLILNPVSGRLQKSEIRRLDVVFPALHGSHGEDGTLQGLLELADIPYVGCGVLASAIANDKWLTKVVLQQQGIPVIEGMVFSRSEWAQDKTAVLERIRTNLPFPLFIKPATLGSSIGVGRVTEAEQSLLEPSIELALNFDRRVLVERAVTGGVEVNCAVMGSGTAVTTSVLEQPVSWEQFLTYEEKYMRGGGGMKSAERIIPAPFSTEQTAAIQQTARQAFNAIDGRGIARIDFLVDPVADKVYLNEINTLPGSLAFYLWQEGGLSPRQVVDQLVRLAFDSHAEKRRSTYDYQTSLIELTAVRGLKGLKGSTKV